MIEYSMLSLPGGRDNNEDYITKASYGDDMCFILCDGLGGHDCGEVASAYVAGVVAEEFSLYGDSPNFLADAFNKAQQGLLKLQEERGMTNAMKTTMVGLVVTSELIKWAHIGDSRLYAIEGDIKQITMDHSLVEEMIRNGELERKKGRNHPEKNIITKAMGSKDEIVPDFFEIEIKPEGKYLLCSDGLSNMVEDDEKRDIVVESYSLDETTQALIDRANYYGGSDNVSVVIISL